MYGQTRDICGAEVDSGTYTWQCILKPHQHLVLVTENDTPATLRSKMAPHRFSNVSTYISKE